jgi:hypothetical protein
MGGFLSWHDGPTIAAVRNSRTACRIGHIDPKPTFPLDTGYGRNAHMSSPFRRNKQAGAGTTGSRNRNDGLSHLTSKGSLATPDRSAITGRF